MHGPCTAHVRRYFTDALKANGVNPNNLPIKPGKGDRIAIKGLNFSKTLYTID